MNDQLTQCPHCQTSFRVTPGQLKAADGVVRCGSCLGLFSAAINSIRVKPDAEERFDADVTEIDDGEEAGDILFADPVLPRSAAYDDYEPYEEYEEAPDLLANLALPPEPKADETLGIDASHASDGNPARIEYDAADSDQFGGPSEEFRPGIILFDEEEEDAEDEDDESEAPAAHEAHAAQDEGATSAAWEAPILEEHAIADDSPPDVAAIEATDREPLAERYDPVLGDLDADEFDMPELGELDPEEFLYDETDDHDDDVEVDGVATFPDEENSDEEIPDDEYPGEELPDEELSEAEFAGDFAEAPGEPYEEYAAAAPAAGFGGAVDAPTVDKSKPDWLQRPDNVPPEKAALHDYLATLEDEDELEPLGTAHLDELDDEPVLLAADQRSRSLLATTGLALLSLLLIGTLVLQFVDQHLEALRQRNSFARFEPWFCAILDCPPAQAPVSASSSLYSQELLVRSHPRLQGALELSFIFRNDADAAQPFPGLELSFKDLSDRLLAKRLLLPAEYLPPELRSLAAMPAHSSVQVMLELVDPGAEAVNYTIAFRDL